MTNQEKREQLVERVRALLAMTTDNGCTEAEALTAAALASQIMEEYDLAIDDVKSIGDERIAQQSKPYTSAERPREIYAAAAYVSTAIGEFFDCKTWRQSTEIIFFGLKDDVELAHAMLAMIRAAMDRELADFMRSAAAQANEHPRTLTTSFMKGMGYRVSDRLRHLKAMRTANVAAQGTNIVVFKGNLVEEAFAEIAAGLGLKPSRHSPPKSAVAFWAGKAAGDRVYLGKEDDAYWKLSIGAPKDRAPPKPSATPLRVIAEVALAILDGGRSALHRAARYYSRP